MYDNITYEPNEESDLCGRLEDGRKVLLGMERGNKKGCLGFCKLTLCWVRGSVNFVPWRKVY